jgi:hypothetical protein
MARRSVCVPLIRTAFIFSLVLLSSPAIAQNAVSDSNQVGYPPFGTFSGSNFDQVAFQNGNLHISIPIQSLTQRNGKTYTWHFVYDIPSWAVIGQYTPNSNQIAISSVTPCGGPAMCNFNLADWRLISNQAGWTVSYQNGTVTCSANPTPVTYGVIDDIVVTDPEGALHPVEMEFANSGSPTNCDNNVTSGLTMDGSGVLVTGSWPDQQNNYIHFALTLKDGTQITPVIIGAAGGQQPTWEDNNGNQQSATADMLDREPLTVNNAPNTSYTTPLGNQVTGPASTTWSYYDSNGEEQSFTLNYQAIDISTHLGCLGTCTQYSASMLVPATLMLPQSSGTYTFSWQNDDSGEL